MNTQQLLHEILAVLKTVQDDKAALEKIHAFMFEEICEEPDSAKIPDKYKKAVTSIADALTVGYICYFNPDNLEVEDVPKEMVDNPEYFESLTGDSGGNLKHEDWERTIELRPLDSHKSFFIMESFAEQLDDDKFQRKLIYVLNNRKPFANFNQLIHNSGFRQEWFDFRQKEIEKHVWQEIESEIKYK